MVSQGIPKDIFQLIDSSQKLDLLNEVSSPRNPVYCSSVSFLTCPSDLSVGGEKKKAQNQYFRTT